ncbi:guanine deaminase [Candidatus Dependentiae bacterium]|nr:guanine deaminase [Candidatus Dependentiae bacterium]
MKIIKGNIINPLNRLKTEYFENYAIAVEDGKIAELFPFKEIEKKYGHTEYSLVDFSGKFISPGFIDNHLHIPQVNQRARYGENLMDWLNKYILNAEESFADPKIAEREIRNCFNCLIANGTTTAVMYNSYHKSATELAFSIAEKSGLKVFIGKTMMDFFVSGRQYETTEQSLRDSYDLFKKWNGKYDGRLNYIFSPRFAPACSFELLMELGNIAKKEHIYIQSHLSENKEEIDHALNKFFGFETYTDIYYRAGLLTEKTIMGHCIHLTDYEFNLLKETGTKIAHCPSSNFFLKSGSFNLGAAEKKGIELGLGSDVGAGPSFSLFDVMKSLNYAQPYHIPPQKSFYYSTLGNARVLGIDSATGNFEKGKDADFIVIDVKKYHNDFEFLSIEDLLAYLIYLGHEGFITDVYVRGEKIDFL